MQEESPTAQKSRSGLHRIMHAVRYSIAGFKEGLKEPAFRQEIMAASVLIPSAFWLGRHWLETAFLIAVLALVMLAELLNSAIERAIDRIGPQWHALSKSAKDLGSAAVFLAILLCCGVWLAALYARLA